MSRAVITDIFKRPTLSKATSWLIIAKQLILLYENDKTKEQELKEEITVVTKWIENEHPIEFSL